MERQTDRHTDRQTEKQRKWRDKWRERQKNRCEGERECQDTGESGNGVKGRRGEERGRDK